ncbi:MAG: hypothetical protein ABSD79_02790 [Dehalococcoidales bacterium]|jgi:hypothetical protein
MTQEKHKTIVEWDTASSLYYHLSQIHPGNVTEPAEELDDPPDFWIMVKQINYAVEATALTDQALNQYYGQVRDLVHKINSQLPNIVGKYIMLFIRQPQLPKKGKSWDSLASSIAEKLNTMINLPPGSQTIFQGNSLRSIQLMKLTDEGSLVYPSVMSGGTEMTKQLTPELFIQELYRVMTASINEKAEKLKRKGIINNSILALSHTFYSIEDEEVKTAFSMVKDYKGFHSIYMALPRLVPNVFIRDEPVPNGFFLYSSNPEWK